MYLFVDVLYIAWLSFKDAIWIKIIIYQYNCYINRTGDCSVCKYLNCSECKVRLQQFCPQHKVYRFKGI